MTLQEKLDKWFVETVPHSETGIGVEIELPVVPFEPGAVPPELAAEITELAGTMGYVTEDTTDDGYIWVMRNAEGSKLSFDTTWNTLEFSLHPRHELISLYADYLKILMPMQRLCMERGYFLCGRGINPNYKNMDAAPLKYEKMLMLGKFLNSRAPEGDGEIFHAVCASVQTHLDAHDLPSFLRLLRILRKAYVFEALFFANSLPTDASFNLVHPGLKPLARDTLCFRDEIWKYCGAPNTDFVDADFETLEDFRAYLKKLRVFVTEDGCIEPVLPEEFLKGHENEAERIIHFRSYEPVAPTKLGTIEVRSTCVQPLDAMLEPAAFYTGLAAVPEESEALLNDVFDLHFPGLNPCEARDRLMRRSDSALRSMLRPDGRRLLELSMDGLKKRGFGEEVFLKRLSERLEKNAWLTPAEYLGADALCETQRQMENLKIGEQTVCQ